MVRNKKARSSKGSTSARSKTRARAKTGLLMRYLVISGKDHMKVSRSTMGKLEHISLSGLVFQTPALRQDDLHLSYDEYPLVRNRLILEIQLPGGRRFTAVGMVSWYERSFVADDVLYHVGVSFTEATPENREALKEYLVATETMAETIPVDV